MGYGVKVLVEGEYALFTRPELKVERYTYDFLTPSAAIGILESIYWKLRSNGESINSCPENRSSQRY